MEKIFLTDKEEYFEVIKAKFYKTKDVTKRYRKIIDEKKKEELEDEVLIALWFSKALVPVITAKNGVYRLQEIDIRGKIFKTPGIICEKLGLKKHGDVIKIRSSVF